MDISIKRFHFNKFSDLLFVEVVTAIGVSMLNPIWSLYFYSFFNNNSLVGFFSSILSSVALVSFFIFTPLIQKYSENKIYFYALLVSIFVLMFIAFNENFYLLIILAVVYVMMSVLRAETFGIMFRNESKTKVLGKNEGLIYTLSNVGWIIGSLFVVVLLTSYNISNVFIFSALFSFLGLVIFLLYRRNQKKEKNYEMNILKNIKDFFKNNNLRNLYLTSFGVSCWLGFIFIYMPLYITENNLSASFVGTFIFIFLLPHLLQYFIGRKSDFIGTKIFINLGYLIMGVFTLLAFIANNINLVLFFLVMASFGVAMILPTKEIHFFKMIKKKEEEKYYGIFLTHIEVGLLLGKLVPALILLKFPFKITFFVLAVIIFIFLLLSLKLKDV